jgi:CheY-like chemotaxis protein
MVADRDGWEVLEVLKSEGDLRNIPVVVASIVDDEARAIAMGAEACLPKPIDRNRLLSAIERGLRATPSVLVVDSDDEMRSAVANALGLAGWKVHEATGGASALKILDADLPAVVLIDPAVSDMSDTEFFTTVRNNPVWKAIPMVAYGVPQDDPVVGRYNEHVQAIVTKGDRDQSIGLIGHAVATLLAPKGDDTG